MVQHDDLHPSDVSAIVEMALSDHVPFETIKIEYGLSAPQVQALMRRTLKASSYRNWRKRVQDFGSRRAQYK